MISPNMYKLIETPIIGYLEEEKECEGLYRNEYMPDDDKENNSFFSNKNFENIAQSHPEETIH